jgi:hypothetical protein
MKRRVSSLWLLVLGTLVAAVGALELAGEIAAPDSVIPVLLVLAPVAALIGFGAGKTQRAAGKMAEPVSADIIPFVPRPR